MILERVPDEPAALKRFYELLDEHRGRKPRIVATIQDHRAVYKKLKHGQNLSEATQRMMPDAITLVAYTDDPGLFLTSESSEHFPGKDRLFHPSLTGIKWEMIKIVDQDAFDRWLAEDWRAGKLSTESARSSRETDNQRPQ